MMALVLYKPDMRKWMRERVLRRKKTKEETKTESTQAPLQPAYFDTPPLTAEPLEHEQPAAALSAPEPLEPVSAEPEMMVAPAAQPARTRPPSRRRGGRGRGRSSARPAAASGEAKPVLTKTDDASQAAVAPQATVQVAAPKGTVVLAIGLPGSGKSSWFKRNNITPLSSDMLRSLLFDDPTEQRFQDLVFSNLRSMLKARLIARRPMNYVDTTNLTPQERQNWIKLARDYGYEVQAVYFDVPLEICLERNAKRQRTVPEDAMRRMSAKLKAPAFDEGFSKITLVRVKQK